MAEFPLKKIKILIIFCLFIGIMESVVGFATLYTGMLYREFDKNNAEEILGIIKSTDQNYYEKLINPEDTEYLKEFERVNTKYGNRLLIVYGIIIIGFSFGCLIPISIILNSILTTGKEKPEESFEEGAGKAKEERL